MIYKVGILPNFRHKKSTWRCFSSKQ